MKKNEHTDWTDALRDRLHDAEITPSDGGWERLLRDLEGGAVPQTESVASERSAAPERRQTPVSGSLRPERDGQSAPGSLRDGRPIPTKPLQPAAEGGKPRWRILGLRIAAAAAVVAIAIVGGGLLWHPDRSADTIPELASVAPREDAGSGSRLRDEVAEASGWSQGPVSDAEPSREADSGAVNASRTLLAAADAEQETADGESASARKRVTTRLAAGPLSEPAPEGMETDSRTGVEPAVPESRKEAGATTDSRDETDPMSKPGAASRNGLETAFRNGSETAPRNGLETASRDGSETEADNVAVQGLSAAETRSAETSERGRTAETRGGQQPSEERRTVSEATRQPSDELYAWANPAFEDEEAGTPRRRRASFSLFAAGGTSSGGNLQTADFLASPPTGNASPSIVGNGDRFGPLVRDDYNESSFRHHLPLSFGFSVTAEFPYGLSIESGVNYTLLRSDVRRSYSSREISQKLHFIGVPLRLNWQFVERGRLAVYLAGGGMVEKCVSARLGGQSVDESKLQWSLMGALGAQYRLGDMIGLYFEPELSYYLTDTELRTSRSDAPLTLTLRIGVRLLF